MKQGNSLHRLLHFDLGGGSPNNGDENGLPIYWIHHKRSEPSQTERNNQRIQRMQHRVLRVLHAGTQALDRFKQTKEVAQREGLLRALFAPKNQ